MKTTNNKLMSDVMQANLGLLPLIMDNIPQAVFWKDRNLVYLGCNRAFADDAGFSSPEDVIGKTDYDMPWKVQAELYRADDSAVMEKGEPKINYEEPQTTPGGSTIWLSTSKIPVRENGQVVAVLGMYEDITARKQVEADLLLRDRALASSLNAVIIVNISDNKPIYVNDALLKMTGHTREEVMQIGLSDITGNAEESKKIRDAIQTQGFFVGEELLKRKDGSVFPANFFSSLIIGAEGRPVAVQSTFFDITDRKQAEEALRQTQSLYQSLIEVSPMSICRKDLAGRFTFANQRFLDLSQTTLADLVGKTDFDLHPSELADKYRRDDLAVMESGQVKEFVEERMVHEGEIAYVETIKAPIYDETGKVNGIQISFWDITARMQAEQAQKESEERFKRFTEATVEGLVFHEQGKIIDVNPAALAMFSLSDSKELIGKNLLEYIVPESHKMVLQQMQLETVLPYEIQCVRSDGTIFPVETSTRIYKAGDRIIRASSIRDITERKKAEAQLSESEARYQLLSESTIEGIVIHDKGILLDANQNFSTMFRYDPKEVIGMSAMEFLTPETREITAQNIRSGYEKPYDVVGLRKDGSTFPVEITGKAIPYQGRTVRVAALRDITERKQLEAKIQETLERRGYQVLVSTEISQEVSAAPKLDELFERVVTLTKERLGYYHTQLLRYDPAQDAVVLINGYGKTGKKMLEGGHKMPMGSGLIGTAAATGETLMRSTLAEDLTWQPNPLLPDTKGEIAVPIKWQNNILGVLDVQSDKAGSLTEDDRLLLEGICGQVGIAMHSAELVETIRQNEARLAEALKIARLGNWEYDFENDLFHFTDEFYSIFHTTAEKVGGYKISSADYAKHFVHPEDAPLVGTEIQKVLDARDRLFTTHLEHRIIFADGEVGYISVNINVERDENGKITRWYGANQDITERKKVEEALRINEASLAEALRAARLANWEYDVEKDLFTFNDQFYSIFHTTAEKVGGYQLSSARYAELFVHPDDMEVVGTEIGKALSSTERVYNTSIDHRILYADGGVGYITVQLTVERDENGKITRYYGANQDITERRKAQEELAERLEEINRLYQNLSHEGWKTYRETADLPSGFVFDQTGVKPVEGLEFATDRFANIPMKVLGGEVVGNLAIADDPQRPISENDLDFLQQVSEQIALALEGARLSAQTQSALAQSEILFEASRRLAQASDLQELLKTVIETFNIPVINGAELNMFSYDSEGELDSLTVVANWWNGTGKEPGAIGSHYPKAMFSAVKLFLTSTPVFISDTSDSESMDASMLRIVQAFNIRAATFLPLFIGAQQIGVLVMHAEEPHEFTEGETRLFSGLAPQIATVLENRRQFERARQQAEREGKLNIISQKIQSATSVEAVLQIAARELGHALGAPMTIAQLSMKDKK